MNLMIFYKPSAVVAVIVLFGALSGEACAKTLSRRPDIDVLKSAGTIFVGQVVSGGCEQVGCGIGAKRYSLTCRKTIKGACPAHLELRSVASYKVGESYIFSLAGADLDSLELSLEIIERPDGDRVVYNGSLFYEPMRVVSDYSSGNCVYSYFMFSDLIKYLQSKHKPSPKAGSE